MENQKVVKQPDDPKKNTHSYMVLGTLFEIDRRYEIIDPIGQGAYGIVVAAKDKEIAEDGKNEDGSESNLVAIKQIIKAFEHRVFSLRTYRELKN